MSGIWIVFPPWLYAVLITLLGRRGQQHWLRRAQPAESAWPKDWGTILLTNLVFLSLIPTSLLSVIGVLLPFTGARAGLSLGLLAFLFGSVPSRLVDSADLGWDRTLWLILIDFIRIGGAMTIVGYLVA